MEKIDHEQLSVQRSTASVTEIDIFQKKQQVKHHHILKIDLKI